MLFFTQNTKCDVWFLNSELWQVLFLFTCRYVDCQITAFYVITFSKHLYMLIFQFTKQYSPSNNILIFHFSPVIRIPLNERLLIFGSRNWKSLNRYQTRSCVIFLLESFCMLYPCLQPSLQLSAWRSWRP